MGDKVWLDARNLKLQVPRRKFGKKRLGPYKIIGKVGPVAYRLLLPDDMQVHPVFHVSLLEPYHTNPFPTRRQESPPPIYVEGEPEYVVEELLNSREHDGHGQYLVKWQGYALDEATWEPFENISHLKRLVQHYHQQHPNQPGPWS